MLGFMGVDLLFDETAIDPVPAVVNNINDVSASGADIKHLVLTKNVTSASTTSTDYTTWDNDTVMNASFMHSLAAGNVDFLGQTISCILIKRKNSRDITSTWVTIGQIDIDGDASKLDFSFVDITNRAETYYKYGLVPVFSQTQPNGVTIEIEGTPIESSEVYSEFEGVFMCDADARYKFYAGVSYGDTAVNQEVGTHTTLGRQYPILISNSATRYKTGSVTANMIPEDLLVNGLTDDSQTDRVDMVDFANEVAEFLTNKKPKIIKDWNGNVWLCAITDNPSVSYDANWGMGLPIITATWTEVGDPMDSDDLGDAGITGYEG